MENKIIASLRGKSEKEKLSEQISAQADERINNKIGSESEVSELKENVLLGVAAKLKIDNDVNGQDIETTIGSQEKVNNVSSKMTNKFVLFEQDVVAVKNINKKLSNKLNTFENEITNIQSSNKNLSQELNTFKNEVSEIKDINRNLDTKISSMENNITFIRTLSQKLQSDIASLEKRIIKVEVKTTSGNTHTT